MAFLILEKLIDLCNATGVDTFSIEIATSNGVYIIEKMSDSVWAIDIDDETTDQFITSDRLTTSDSLQSSQPLTSTDSSLVRMPAFPKRISSSKFVSNEEILDWFRNDQIEIILLHKIASDENIYQSLIIYQSQK